MRTQGKHEGNHVQDASYEEAFRPLGQAVVQSGVNNEQSNERTRTKTRFRSMNFASAVSICSWTTINLKSPTSNAASCFLR